MEYCHKLLFPILLEYHSSKKKSYSFQPDEKVRVLTIQTMEFPYSSVQIKMKYVLDLIPVV